MYIFLWSVGGKWVYFRCQHLLKFTEKRTYFSWGRILRGCWKSTFPASIFSLRIRSKGGIFNPFMQMYLTWGPLPWALGLPPLFSLIILYKSQNISLAAIGQKKASSHSLVTTRDTGTENTVELRWDPPGQYLNNRSHGQNLRSTPGQAENIAQYFCKILPLEWFAAL